MSLTCSRSFPRGVASGGSQLFFLNSHDGDFLWKAEFTYKLKNQSSNEYKLFFNFFYSIFRFISLNHFQAKIFYKILREKESYMVKVGKQDTKILLENDLRK